MKKKAKKSAAVLPLVLAFLFSACGAGESGENTEITSTESSTVLTETTPGSTTKAADGTTSEAKPETSAPEKKETVPESSTTVITAQSQAAESKETEASENVTAAAEKEPENTDYSPVKEFYFESEITDGKKLSLSFAASPLENDPAVYSTDVTSTSVSVSAVDENGVSHISQTDVLRSPVNGQGTFFYYSDYDIPMKLLPCNDDGNSYAGLVCVPKGDGTYFTTIYIYRSLKFTIINDLFPEVRSIDDITLDGSKISFYDALEEKNVSYRLDLGGFTSKKIPDMANAVSFEELAPENAKEIELNVREFNYNYDGGAQFPVEYDGITYEYNFTYCDFIMDKNKNIFDLEAYNDNWKLDPENKMDRILMNFEAMEYAGRTGKTQLGAYAFDKADIYKYEDNLIIICNDEMIPRYSADFRNIVYGFEYFEDEEALRFSANQDNIKGILADRGIDYDPDVFLHAMLYEKSERLG